MLSFLLKQKKLIACLILGMVCFGIFSNAVYQIAPARATGEDVYPGSPLWAGIGEDQAAKVKEVSSGGGGSGLGLLGDAAIEAANWILSAISWFAAKIISFEAGILNWILNPKNFRLATAPIVKTGWEATRTTVNMLFVLVLLIVAFSTILRIETWNIKAVLPRLILVALLINFSLVIAGALLDLANVGTAFFYQSLGKNSSDIAAKLQNGLKITNFFAPNEKLDPKVLEGLFHGIEGVLLSFSSLLIGTLFLLATIFIFAALIVMMLIRILYLWILLILAPAAWFFYITPAWQSLWYKWWSNFFRWAFFAPIAMFFIYLSITTLDNMGKKTIDQTGFDMSSLTAAGQVTTAGQKDLTKNPVEAIFQFFLGTGLILGSLMAANSMSITGAGVAVNLGQKGAKGLGAWTGRRAGRTLTWGARPATEKEPEKKSWFERGLKQIARVPGVGQIARPGYSLLQRQQEYISKKTAAYEKMPEERRKTLYNRLSKEDQAAIELVRLKEKETYKTLDDKEKLNALGLMQKYGFTNERKEMLKLDPKIAYAMTTNPAQQTKILEEILASMKADDWKAMDQKLWTDVKNGAKSINTAHNAVNIPGMASMLQNLNFEGKKVHQQYINNIAGPLPPGATPEMKADARKVAYEQGIKGGHKKVEYLESVIGRRRVLNFGDETTKGGGPRPTGGGPTAGPTEGGGARPTPEEGPRPAPQEFRYPPPYPREGPMTGPSGGPAPTP